MAKRKGLVKGFLSSVSEEDKKSENQEIENLENQNIKNLNNQDVKQLSNKKFNNLNNQEVKQLNNQADKQLNSQTETNLNSQIVKQSEIKETKKVKSKEWIYKGFYISPENLLKLKEIEINLLKQGEKKDISDILNMAIEELYKKIQ